MEREGFRNKGCGTVLGGVPQKVVCRPRQSVAAGGAGREQVFSREMLLQQAVPLLCSFPSSGWHPASRGVSAPVACSLQGLGFWYFRALRRQAGRLGRCQLLKCQCSVQQKPGALLLAQLDPLIAPGCACFLCGAEEQF